VQQADGSLEERGASCYVDEELISRSQGIDEINFRQPGGKTLFRALQPGEPFLFKLHALYYYIANVGFFAPASLF
jgi:putative restriction endonuclease